ncbi:MAG: sugar ABC transporter ATP-binding protein [Acidimicrobiia bacterium]|nr:sugar ABC transporter ATP-binding protein [Acidimicrobiia bacterium]
MSKDQQPILALRSISKRFGATQALADVELNLFPGEVHALVGENGAGKSTLIKIATGIHQPDTGTMELAGEPFHPGDPAAAQRQGVAAIYQEPSIFPDLSVAENIFIGHQDRGLLVDRKAMERDAATVLGSLDMDLNPSQPAGILTVAGQQAVEIAKAISLDVRILIMDEPTAALSAHEVKQLFRQVQRLRELGVAVLFISHRLDEVFEIADRVSIFRDGRHISSRPISEVTEELMVREMVGRDPSEFFVRTRTEPGDVVLSVDGLGRRGVFRDVSFEVRRGEVLGFAGLVGAGRTDIALALFGVAPADEGTITVNGTPVTIGSPTDALRHGIAYLSEDRRKLGLSMTQSVTTNITLATLDRYTSPLGLVDRSAEAADAAALRDRLGIVTASLDSPVEHLSGGNQQKTMLGKWLNAEPQILILDEPTRGIDVGAKAEVHRFVDELARSGMAIIMISSDLPEVLAMSDRIAIMREGRLEGIRSGDDANQETVMAMAVGVA